MLELILSFIKGIILLFRKPILDVKFNYVTSSQVLMGMSSYQNGESVLVRDAKSDYCLSVTYALIVTNNSPITAYSVKLEKNNSLPNDKNTLDKGTLVIEDKNMTLRDGENVAYKITYSKEFYGKTGHEIKKILVNFHWTGEINIIYKKRKRVLQKIVKIETGKIVL